MFLTGFTSLCLTSFSYNDPLLCLHARFLILLHLIQMRFSWSTHLQMYLSLEILTSIISTGLPIPELTDLVNSVIILLSQVNLLKWLIFLLQSQTVILTAMLFWIYLFLLMLVFVLQWLSLHWEILIMLLFHFPLTFHHIHNVTPHFITLLMTILVPIGTVFVIIWEMFHRRISLNSVLLLLMVHFESALRLELMYISLLKVSGQASLISMVFSCLCSCHSS